MSIGTSHPEGRVHFDWFGASEKKMGKDVGPVAGLGDDAFVELDYGAALFVLKGTTRLVVTVRRDNPISQEALVAAERTLALKALPNI